MERTPDQLPTPADSGPIRPSTPADPASDLVIRLSPFSSRKNELHSSDSDLFHPSFCRPFCVTIVSFSDTLRIYPLLFSASRASFGMATPPKLTLDGDTALTNPQ